MAGMWWVTVLFMGLIAVLSYSRAKQMGMLTRKIVGIHLAFFALLFAVFIAPVLLINSQSPYFIPVFLTALAVCLAGIVWFAIYAKRWARPVKQGSTDEAR
ncbi:MAG: hypothetical protein ABSD70_05650 [Terracidiphilus sp.]